MTGDVFHEEVSRSHVADHAPDVIPEPPLVFDATTLAGDGERLARITGSDEIHAIAKRLAVEGREIVPDRSWIHGLVCHPRHEDGCGVSAPLDNAHAA